MSIVYPVSFSHDPKPVAGVRSNKKAAYKIIEEKNKLLRNSKGEFVPLPLRYDQVNNELNTHRVVRIPLADNTVATILAEEISSK